ncbi:hypothetical protein MUY27_00315 [Mucilaginibacter sp. RS28]|uniref:Uncharacterized protein n=1 Tax=Mucilaginibacter straminoryzae TaxID=2932774 RepID=A0A9X2BBF1_9SPHI|nr:hypothetical protein [Mucilaginibacter straminoryzae]MCJ8208128.1 hypothetical protein [Mucilaginibacter straminoryzae]
MKPLHELVNIEKARLLHELFPQEMPQFLEYTLSVSEYVQQDEEKLRQQWQVQFFTLEAWISLARNIESKIKKFSTQYQKSSKVFSEQLFDFPQAAFMTHCLGLYTSTQQLGNRKFTLAADLLFDTADYLQQQKG